MEKRKFKYHINHYLSILPVSIEDFSRTLEKEFHISADIFHQDRSLESDADTDIPFSRLRIYAFLLGTSVDLLVKSRQMEHK